LAKLKTMSHVLKCDMYTTFNGMLIQQLEFNFLVRLNY